MLHCAEVALLGSMLSEIMKSYIRVEGMKDENSQRMLNDYALAYTMGAFEEEASRLDKAIAQQIEELNKVLKG